MKLGLMNAAVLTLGMAWGITGGIAVAHETAVTKGADAVPDTPSGKRLKGWVAAVSTGDYETIYKFIEGNYAKSELEKVPIAERAMRSMNRFRDFGKNTPLKLIESSEYETTVLGESGLTEEWTTVKMIVSPEGDHPIIGVMLMPGSAPSEIKKAAPTSDKEVVERIQSYAKKLTDADEFSGVILLAKGDNILLEKGYGYADLDTKAPNGKETKFGLASMGKMFTAVAIAQLVEAGKLSYNDTLAKVLPDYPNKETAEKITLHHLLTHTSGLGDYFFKPGWGDPSIKLDKPSDYFQFFAKDPLQIEPGSGWAYSNGGFMVLGAIIEKASGQNFLDYVKEHIFKPAGMTRTGYAQGKPVDDLAVGYTRMSGPGWQKGPSDGGGGPAGGGYSTAEDMLKFARALLNHKLVSRKSLETLTTGKAEAQGGGQYAYGFEVQRENDRVSFGHGGGFPGVCTRLDIYPKGEYIGIVLSNYDPMTGYYIANKFRGMVTQR